MSLANKRAFPTDYRQGLGTRVLLKTIHFFNGFTDHKRAPTLAKKLTIHPDKLMKLPDLTAHLKIPEDYPIARALLTYHPDEKMAK